MTRAVRGALAALVVLGCALPTAAAAAPPTFWLGPSFEGLPITHEEEGFIVYGDCTPEPDSGCSPPLQVQNASTCDRNPVALDIAPRRVFELPGGAIAATYEPGHAEVGTGRSGVAVFGNGARQVMRALTSLRPRSQEEPAARLAPPTYPGPVMRELKRILVARSRYPTVRAIARATGVPRSAVRGRLRLARLLGERAFRGVREPARSWRAVERDRQAAFLARELGERRAAKRLGVSREELRRIVRRVRGLVGYC